MDQPSTSRPTRGRPARPRPSVVPSDSDSDDSMELTMEDCNRLTKQYNEILEDMEIQFVHLKHLLFFEKKNLLQRQMNEIKNGTSEEYLSKMTELHAIMTDRIDLAANLRDFSLKSVDQQFDAEELAANQDFRNNKQLLYDELKRDLLEKVRKLKEEKRLLDLQRVTPVRRRRRRQPLSVAPPYIVYMISEEEINEDWLIMKRILEDDDD